MMMMTMALMMVTLDSKHVSYVMVVILELITDLKKIKNAPKLAISINAFVKNEVPSRVRFV